MLLSKMEIVDPSMPHRRRVAERIVWHFKSQSSSGVPECLHVGCAGGNDLELIYSIMGDSSVELYGVDIMEAPLQMGKQKLPMATFQPADIEQSLPFEDNTFHCILASRLLVHVVDLPKACDELIRVLKPGGLFICCEANMDVSMQLLTTDRRLQGNLQTKVQHMTKMCANPDAATLAYIINIFRHVRQPVVDIQSYSCVVPQPKHMDPTLIMDSQFLSKLVESGELAAEDQDTICGIMLLEEMNTVPPPTET